jgi:hypothetical protein
MALTESMAASAPVAIGGGDLACGGGSDAARVILGGVSAAGAGVSLEAGAGAGVSIAGIGFGAASGLISILACWANVSDVGGTISWECFAAGG